MEKGKEIYVLRVFVNKVGEFGNPMGVVFDEGRKLNTPERCEIAKKNGFSEIVFVNDISLAQISIHNPQNEIPFSGYAILGTAWLLSKIKNEQIQLINCLEGPVSVEQEDDLIWVTSNVSMTPHWNFEEKQNVTEVEQIQPYEMESKEHTLVWAWINKDKGFIRARTFAPDWGITEDEANGSGAMKLASQLGREIEILHGKGSIIYAQPGENGLVSVGGRVAEDTMRYL